jgi:hypothetical protein
MKIIIDSQRKTLITEIDDEKKPLWPFNESELTERATRWPQAFWKWVES